MTHDKDEIWGSTGRRPLPPTRVDWSGRRTQEEVVPFLQTGAQDVTHSSSPFGPEAEERAQMMSYERIKRIQEESPYTREDVVEVEHVVHDYRLYIGMWIVAGVSAVAAFLTYSVACVVITLVAVAFALSATPGRQKKY